MKSTAQNDALIKLSVRLSEITKRAIARAMEDSKFLKIGAKDIRCIISPEIRNIFGIDIGNVIAAIADGCSECNFLHARAIGPLADASVNFFSKPLEWLIQLQPRDEIHRDVLGLKDGAFLLNLEVKNIEALEFMAAAVEYQLIEALFASRISASTQPN